ncbi:MAG: PhoX family phosphatase [Gammaproteobacteria bacterium]|jgi:hypothetical protein|nr:PhoX family phosphatase [Gammaproteobacteria bacterium]
MRETNNRSNNPCGIWDDDGSADVLPGSAARPRTSEPFSAILERAVDRRGLLKGAAFGATLVIAQAVLLEREGLKAEDKPVAADPRRRLRFRTVPPGNEQEVMVPPNYRVHVVLAWGDPLFPGAPDFDVSNQTSQAQARQFGFNADLVLWYPLPKSILDRVYTTHYLPEEVSTALGKAYPTLKKKSSERALVVVNHEYTKARDMFPDYDKATYPTLEQTRVEIEAHGFSIVELVLDERGQWRFNIASPFNRRVTGSTPMEITGPLRGHPLMQTLGNPAGTEVRGCLNNCAGGKTPWGTVLTCEENFDQYFANFDAIPSEYLRTRELNERIPAESEASERLWERHVGRFDCGSDPNEYNRFGYIVEIDPYNPLDKPKKRTALGRFKHEGAAATVTRDGRVAIYSGDDAGFEYVYKFVTRERYEEGNRLNNLNLLDKGTLYVARFDAGVTKGDEMGTGEWLPVVWESGNALDRAGFASQAEVLINTRGAADILGATPMDRPEDIEVSPVNGHVYIALTNNSKRSGDDLNEANPRGPNPHGHIVELIEDGDDAGSLTFAWNILVKCGDPSVPEHETRFGDIADPVESGVSPISDPDNLVHDDDGNLWIATDGQFFSGDDGFGQNDGIFAVPVEGPERGLLRQFLSGVPGGEVCGPEFSGDNRTFYCAIQHPNDGDAFEKIWPMTNHLGEANAVSRPSLIAVREKDGRKIGY